MPDRLESWKEIAAHFGRRVRTVQRWEREEGLPVHRHLHKRGGNVFASRAELDRWWASRVSSPAAVGGETAAEEAPAATDAALAAAAAVPPTGDGSEPVPERPAARRAATAPSARPAGMPAATVAEVAASLGSRAVRRAVAAAGLLLALLAGGLFAARLARQGAAPAADPEAVLQARYLLHRGTPEAARRALALCAGAAAGEGDDRRARAAQAAAFECLAHADYVLTRHGEVPLAEGIARTLAAADEAVALDPRRAEAMALAATARVARDWDLAAAEARLRQAVSRDPAAALPHHRLAHVLSLAGRHGEAIEALRAAQHAAPLSAAIHDDGCWFFYRARRHAEAIREAERALALEPERQGALECVADAAEALGDHLRAREAAVGLLAALGDPAAATVAAAPPQEAVRRLDERLLARAREQLGADGPAAPFAYFHARLGQRDEAFAWLERARARREPVILLVRVHPGFDSLRSDPRLEPLLRAAGV